MGALQRALWYRQLGRRPRRADLLQQPSTQEGWAAVEEPAESGGKALHGTSGPCDDRMAAGDRCDLLQPASGRRDLAADRATGQWWSTHIGHDVSPRSHLPRDRGVRRLVRPLTDRARVL